MEREVEGAKVGELKRGVTAPGMNGMNMRPCQALPPLCVALPQLVADKHWESNQVSTRPSRAILTVRILRYEIETGPRAVVFCHKQMGDCSGFIGLIIDIQKLVLSL